MTCPLCGSEEVYRGLQRRRRAWLWYMLSFLPVFSLHLFPIVLFSGIALIVIPFTEERVCRNCGLILTR